VRNHGAVPQVPSDAILDWTLSIEGMVERPFTLTLRELMSANYDQQTYPITLVCAGNRRKEQNIVRKTKGFSWGSAGLSTALFTGVAMSDIIRKAKPRRGAKYVCMEGADKLPNGHYGTSVKLNWALDPNRGMMLAYAMNGEALRPDHGQPLRAVIPGQIGGRSVKWLQRLIITAEPSENWYHIYDNRVLPAMVSPEESANNPAWWRDERYAIYDLGTNSVIAAPEHGEKLDVTDDRVYTVRGYAYAGGGRRVTRVEVSLDGGKAWRLASVSYPEDLYRNSEPGQLLGGRLDFGWRESSFCWCFWTLDVGTVELAAAEDLLVRAMDESMNIQPRDMYWNVLGMMNNPWFRVAICRDNDSATALRFEHPTQPALMPGGWMERVKKEGGDLVNRIWGERASHEAADAPGKSLETVAEVKMTSDNPTNVITIDELRKHDTEQAPWFVVNGEVYDGTAFLAGHPGGAQSIVSAAGLDSTDEFMTIHSETAKAMMPQYHIGTLSEEGRAALAGDETSAPADGAPSPLFLQPRAWKHAVLHSKSRVSWDTRILTFKLEYSEQLLGLPTGQHLMIRLRDPVTREAIIRSYTPISESQRPGFMDVLVKIYFDSATQKGGKLSQALESLPIGHAVDFKGPIGKFEYLGGGRCTINSVPRSVKTFYMICGGSGITPIYQVLRAVMQDPIDATQCVVLDGNRLLEDILCKTDLDRYALMADKCKLLYTLTQPPEGWEGLKGRIAEPLLREHVPRLSHGDGEAMVLICGPEALEKSCHKALLEIGWRDEELLFF